MMVFTSINTPSMSGPTSLVDCLKLLQSRKRSAASCSPSADRSLNFLRSDISVYYPQQVITGMKPGEREKWAALEN